MEANIFHIIHSEQFILDNNTYIIFISSGLFLSLNPRSCHEILIQNYICIIIQYELFTVDDMKYVCFHYIWIKNNIIVL